MTFGDASHSVLAGRDDADESVYDVLTRTGVKLQLVGAETAASAFYESLLLLLLLLLLYSTTENELLT